MNSFKENKNNWLYSKEDKLETQTLIFQVLFLNNVLYYNMLDDFLVTSLKAI